jgi:type I restriction enzyme, S subunit
VRLLSDALKARHEAVDRNDSDFHELRLISLRFDGSMDERPERPASIKGKLFRALPGDVVFSKIDLRNGAIGVLPQGIAGGVFTSEFPIYAVDGSMALPSYVQLLFRSEFFRRTINGMVSGASGRKRVAPEQIESMLVPLPPLSLQAGIVDHWNQWRLEAACLEGEAEVRERHARDQFMLELGLGSRDEAPSRRAFALHWSAMGRWGTDTNQPDVKLDVSAGRFPVAKLGDVVRDLENGWSPKCLARPAIGDEWGVLKLGAVSFGRFDPSENKALPMELHPLPALEVKRGDWLISRANIARLVGACALIDGDVPPRLLLCDKIFRAIWHAHAPVLPGFLDEVMKLAPLRHQIESALTGTSPTMKNISKPALLALRLPLPPLGEQERMTRNLTEARHAASDHRRAARILLRDAQANIESALLGQPLLDSERGA